MKRDHCYKHMGNTDVYLYVKDIFVDDKKLTIYSVEWYNIFNGGFIGNDQIKVRKEDEEYWRDFKYESV